MEKVRWGILGPGSIAGQFANSMKLIDGAALAAVGSRSKEKAESFCSEFGGTRAYGSYEDLASDPNVDVIYVATPHPFHKEHTLLALESGKPVLCEKPFAINAGEARVMVSKARENKLFLMEGMWSRFFPVMEKVRDWLTGGAIGSIRIVTADFGFRAGFDPENRVFNPKLGGGALLDVGIYPISFASMVLGKPDRCASLMQPTPTGVDGQSAFILSCGDAMAVLYTSVCATTPWEATILGENGRIRIQSPFWKPRKAVLEVEQREAEVFERPFDGSGFQYEIAHVGECLREGKKESEAMPLNESIEIMETMDSLRAAWGLKYPGE